MKQKRIAVTGGYGNLGSWLVCHLAQAGHHVTVVAKTKRTILDHIEHDFVACDVTDLSNCETTFSDDAFDVIVHAASNSTGTFKDSLEVHTLGTRNILEAIKNQSSVHFVYFSTFQVYGVYEGVIDEQTLLNPKNDYGNTHLFAEYYIRQFALTSKLEYTILRLTNSYGCPCDPNSSQWSLILNDLARSAFEKKEIVLKSNGKAPRDFIWMGHVCEVIAELTQIGAQNDVFNLSGEATFEMLDVANAVQKAYEKTYSAEIAVAINEADTKEYPNKLQVKSSKLRAVLSIQEQHYFEQEAMNIFHLLEKQKV